MKSPDPLDPQRLRVTAVDVRTTYEPDCSDIIVTLSLQYQPWWADPEPDVLWEYANALTCVREALQRGGVGHDF